ncbi:MAG: 50S ribosomal protein L17 [bacterium]
MRHRKYKRKFSRTPSHRRAMMSNLVRSLFIYEQINTTEAKAKAVKALADRLIARAGEDTVHARRLVARFVRDRNLIWKLFHEIAPIAEGDGGGFVRIVKTDTRHGDSAPMALVELVNKTKRYYDRRKAEDDARKAKKEEALQAAEKAREAAQVSGGGPVTE